MQGTYWGKWRTSDNAKRGPGKGRQKRPRGEGNTIKFIDLKIRKHFQSIWTESMKKASCIQRYSQAVIYKPRPIRALVRSPASQRDASLSDTCWVPSVKCDFDHPSAHRYIKQVSKGNFSRTPHWYRDLRTSCRLAPKSRLIRHEKHLKTIIFYIFLK